ncbi:hypothetical protein ACET3Z_011567 [Daucus carota]
MSLNPCPKYAIAWLYIDGNIIQNGFDGYSYDGQMARLVKLDVTLKFKQLCDVICAKLKIDTRLYGLKIRHKCFNPMTKMFDFAPVLDDDDVELMFELVASLGVKNAVVELYLERVLLDGFVEKIVDVPLDVNCLSEQAGFLFDSELGVSRGFGRCGENVDFCCDLGGGGVVVEGCGDFGKRGEDGDDRVGLGESGENGDVGRDFGVIGENMEVNRDLCLGGEEVVRGGLNKKTLCKRRVNSQGRRRVSRGRNKGGESGTLYSSFDGPSFTQGHAAYSNVEEVPDAQVAGDGDPSYQEKVKKEISEV